MKYITLRTLQSISSGITLLGIGLILALLFVPEETKTKDSVLFIICFISTIILTSLFFGLRTALSNYINVHFNEYREP